MPEFVHPAAAAYLASLHGAEDALLEEIRQRSGTDGVPAISPETGWLLHVLAVSAAPRRILEIGTGYGCSGILLARALAPDGMLFTIERDPARAAAARQHFERAGLGSRVSVMVGEASRLVHKVAGPFDLIVQDGSKDQYEPGTRPPRRRCSGRAACSCRTTSSGRATWFPASARIPRIRPTVPRSSSATASGWPPTPGSRTLFLPVGDGVAISVKRDEGSP